MILHDTSCDNIEPLTDGGDGPGTGPKAAPASKQNLTVKDENTVVPIEKNLVEEFA